MRIKVRLTPSKVAYYFNFECDRYLFSNLCYVVDDNTSIQINAQIHDEYNNSPEKLAGQLWERDFTLQLEAECMDKGIRFVNATAEDMSYWLDILDSEMRDCSIDRNSRSIYFVQPCIELPDKENKYEWIDISWGRFFPDILFAKINFNEEKGCPEVIISVMDIKLSATPQFYHIIQVAIYSKLLDELFSDRDDILINSSFGYIVNKPEGINESVIRDIANGVIGNQIGLNGARIIVSNFIEDKIVEMEEKLYNGFSGKVENGEEILAADIDFFMRSSEYIVSSECKNCANFERCSSISKWNDRRSILFLPYLSVEAQKKLWELKRQGYEDALTVSGFEGLEYGNKEVSRDYNFNKFLRNNSSVWRSYLSNEDGFRQSLRSLVEYYDAGGRTRLVSEYFRNDYSSEMPKTQDNAVYLYADEQYCFDRDGDSVRKTAKFAYLISANNQEDRCNTYSYDDVLSDDFGMQFIDGFINELGALDGTVVFYTYSSVSAILIKKLAFSLLKKAKEENDVSLYDKVVKLLSYIQSDEDVVCRDNHPNSFIPSAFVFVIDVVKELYNIPAKIDYDIESVTAFFFGRYKNVNYNEPIEYLNNLKDIVEEIQGNDVVAENYLWGIAWKYSDSYELLGFGQEDEVNGIYYPSFEESICSKLYYESLVNDSSDRKAALSKFFKDVNNYNYFVAKYDSRDEELGFFDDDLNEVSADSQDRKFLKLRIIENNQKAKEIIKGKKPRTFITEASNKEDAIKSFCSYAITAYMGEMSISQPWKWGEDFPDFIYLRINKVSGMLGDDERIFYVTSALKRDGSFTSQTVRRLTMDGSLSNPSKNLEDMLMDPDQAPFIEALLNPSIEHIDDELGSEDSVERVMSYGSLSDRNGNVTEFTGSQRHALEHVLRFRDTLVQGPPGTGKTDFIARSVISIFKHLKDIRQGESVRILMTSNSHAAIINLLNKIYDLSDMIMLNGEMPDIHRYLYKVGPKEDEADEYSGLRQGIQKIYEKQGRLRFCGDDTDFGLVNGEAGEEDGSIIIGLTSWKSYNLGSQWNAGPLGDFDLVIIDEASQVSFAQSIIVNGLKAQNGRCLIVGDDDQLSTIIQGDFEVNWGEIDCYHSVFDYYRSYYEKNYPTADNQICMLNDNFRMNEALLEYSAEKIYGRGYTSFNDDIRYQKLNLELTQNNNLNNNLHIDNTTYDIYGLVEKIIDPEYPLVVCYLKGENNFEQIALEKYLVRMLSVTLFRRMRFEDGGTIRRYSSLSGFFGGHEDNVPPGLGIVVPHRLYRDELKKSLRDEFCGIIDEQTQGESENEYKERIYNTILCDTVDKLQGQEREAIIVSYGMADLDQMNREAEFIYSKNRLNVALTRAKKKMIVILPDNFADYSLEVLKKNCGKIDDHIDFAAGLREYLKLDEDVSINEDEELIMDYLDRNGGMCQYEGKISLYRKRG